MCIGILASFVLFAVVVNSTNCPPRLNRPYCTCSDTHVLSYSIGMNCDIRNLTQIHALSATGFSSRISDLIITLYGISNLPALLFQFDSLETLYIYGESLTSVHKDAFYGVRGTLVSLIFSGTSLGQVPAAAVYNLTQLRNLSLESNLIRFLSYLRNTSLETLTVTNNTVSEIAKTAFPPTLKYLYLSRNKLRSLSGALKYLPHLGYVDISENKINSLHRVFQGTRGLYKLYAESNMITTLNNFRMAPLLNLAYLRLSYNRIREIQHGLKHLPYLTELYLGNNLIETVNETAFQNCTGLRVLKLNYNRIRQLPEGIFDCLSSLFDLDLSNNFLTNMYYLSPPSAGIEQNLESKTRICDFWENLSLQGLDITGNDIVCNERTNVIIQKLRSKEVVILGDMC